MYSSVFDYFLDDENFIMVKATCDDVGAAPVNLKLELPKNFIASNKNVSRGIEEMAVSYLRLEKQLNNKQ